MNEFEIIRTFFARQALTRDDVVLGIGDDAAVVQVPAGQQLVMSTDLLVSGVHFLERTDPESIGHKALAVNLSDLAAMGAVPAWFTLTLSLPRAEPAWLEGFCQGLFALAGQHRLQLVGGDTTRGPLTVGIQICGFVPPGQALTRAGARLGDRVYVTGQLGDAGVGLRHAQGTLDLPEPYRSHVLERLNRPQPRVAAGLGLRGLASACIDISDGLAVDLGHVLEASAVGAHIELPRLPLSPAYNSVFAQCRWDLALAAGDDYELCFTVPPAQEPAFRQASTQFGVTCTYLGAIEAEPGLRMMDESGQLYRLEHLGYDHFSSAGPHGHG